MDITKVNIHLVKKGESKLKAVVSVTIQNAITIHGIKIIEGSRGLFVAMPTRKTENNEYKDIAHPINAAAREELESVIIGEYQKII